jgi:hypothetical protein
VCATNRFFGQTLIKTAVSRFLAPLPNEGVVRMELKLNYSINKREGFNTDQVELKKIGTFEDVELLLYLLHQESTKYHSHGLLLLVVLFR